MLDDTDREQWAGLCAQHEGGGLLRPARELKRANKRLRFKDDDAKSVGAIVRVGWEFTPSGERTFTPKEHPGHYRVLRTSLVNLIEALKTESRVEAWSILVRITAYCPASTNHDLWKKWWDESGRKEFPEIPAK